MTVMTFGSGSIILLGALGLYMRHRHYERYGSLSLAVFCLWTIGIGVVRLLSEWNVLIEHGGVINSWWSVSWAAEQVALVLRAEWSAHVRKLRILRLAALAEALP